MVFTSTKLDELASSTTVCIMSSTSQLHISMTSYMEHLINRIFRNWKYYMLVWHSNPN